MTFLNGGTVLGTAPISGGTATLTTTFAVSGASTNNMVSAIYSGDGNYIPSTATTISIVSGIPSFLLSGVPTSLTVSQGQTALSQFTLTPTFTYTGTVAFSCTGLPATLGCVFSPASVSAAGSNTPSLIGFSVTTVQPGVLAKLEPAGSGLSPVALAGIPGFALLAGLMGQRRKLFASGKKGWQTLLLFGLLALLGMGATGCGVKSTPGTPKGSYTVTVVATGTPVSGSTAPVLQQFAVTLNVQ